MATRGQRLFHWAAIHLTVVPIVFYGVHKFGYDKGYKIGLQEGKDLGNDSNSDANKKKRKIEGCKKWQKDFTNTRF